MNNMENVVSKKDTLSQVQKNMVDYFETHDVKYIHENAVFTNMATGESHKGKAEIGAMLQFMYKIAFDAKVDSVNRIITEDKALVEGYFKGKHIGEFAGIPATNKEVNVPLAVSYALENGLISSARIYFQANVLMQQLGVYPSESNKKTAFVVRDIFQLKFGEFKKAKKLLEEAFEKDLMPQAAHNRVLSDFTGDAYRLVFEEGFNSLADYEEMLSSGMKVEEWQEWYGRFKPLVERSHREILKQVL
jgi:predicted ester cyclase